MLGLLGLGALSAGTIPGPARAQSAAPAGEMRIVPLGYPLPPCRLKQVVYVSDLEMGPTRRYTWQELTTYLRELARLAGGDFVAYAVRGEKARYAPGDEGKWILGVAAQALPAGPDTVAGCDNCFVHWERATLGGSGSDSLGRAAEFDSLAFFLARFRLGARGYYLLDPGTAPQVSDSLVSFESLRRQPYPTLSLQVALQDQQGERMLSRSLACRLYWTISGATLWSKLLSWDETNRNASPAGPLFQQALAGVLNRMARPGPLTDADGDSVADCWDRDQDTDRRARVDRFGVAMDSDHDGVPDYLDREPNSRPGAQVDEWGTMRDEDHDGVDDSHDNCLGTPSDHVVDSCGCDVMIPCYRMVLINTGRITESRILFETGSANLLPEAYATLDPIGESLKDLPELAIEVAGHCDDRGSDLLNQRLSEARARAVVSYLVDRFPALQKMRFTARGYGKSRPLVAGTTAEARRANRRVEFLISNADAARMRVEYKEVLRRGQGAPCDSLGIR